MWGSSKKLKPFLYRPFPTGVSPTITEAWTYGKHEAALYGGYTAHHAIDFAVPTGTPVLAAADGMAIASFEEVRIRYPGTESRSRHGKPIFWGYGLFIAVLHTNRLLTFYAHLHRLADDIWQTAYVPPVQRSSEDVVSPILSLDASDFGSTYRVVTVKAGDVIAYSGITGMGIGRPTYENWRSGVSYSVNDEEHVHFALARSPGMTAATEYLDPFGIYGDAHEYPLYDRSWKLPGSLWHV